jgi:hypothetical protein
MLQGSGELSLLFVDEHFHPGRIDVKVVYQLLGHNDKCF